MFKVFLMLALVVLVAVGNAHAGIDLTGVSLDTAPIFALVTIIMVAIAAIWPAKKLISLGNKS